MGELFCALTRTSLFLIFPLTSKTRELDGVYVVEGMHMLHRTALHLTTHTVLLLDWTFKKWALLSSNLSRDSKEPKTKIIFQFLWGILDGPTNRARPYWPILKKCQNPCMKFEIMGGQMLSFEVLWKCHSVISFRICLRLRPSAYPL